MWSGTKASQKRIENKHLIKLHVGNDVIGSASSVRDLAVIVIVLSMKKYVHSDFQC